MDKAKIFKNGRSQAVRLPKKYRFEGKEVFIKKTEEGVLLIPDSKSLWNAWEKNLHKFKEPILEKRKQPKTSQKRKGLNEVFD